MEKYLNIVCGLDPEDDRPHRNSLWHTGGYSYSTNGFCLLRSPGEYGVPKNKDYPNVDYFNFKALDSAVDCTYLDRVALKKLGQAFSCSRCSPSISEPIWEKCPECLGSGVAKCSESGQVHSCEECDGDGSVDSIWPRSGCTECYGTGVESQAGVWLMGMRLSIAMLLLLAGNLPNLRFYPGAFVVPLAIGFKFSNTGYGALMSMRDF